MKLTINLDPQQAPWLLALLRSYATQPPDPTHEHRDPSSPQISTLSDHIADMAQSVSDQISEQLQGDTP